jgi:UDP-GlcNAc:undecaprenyl-phosphate GlcNAc-1-phosphate transferase
MTDTAGIVLILVAALTGTLLATPLMRRLALRTGVVDQPSARKIHLQPIPLLGGVAIYIGFVLALIFFSERYYVREIVAILVGASLISFMGIWDDRWGLRPLVKLIGQTLAGAILLVAGVSIHIFPWEWLNWIITVLWVAGITNALNLLDNMDGLSGGVAAVASGFFLLLAASSGQYLVSAMAAALLGACLGFLRYNFNPASIFMGDAGSLFLGFMLAALGIKLRFPAPTFPQNADLITWMIPILVLGVPIFDTTLVMISRLRRRKNPFTTPGKDHLSHRLVSFGMTRREAVLSIYVIAFGLGMVAVLVSTVVLRAGPGVISPSDVVVGYGVGGAVAVGACLALVRLERRWSPPAGTGAQGGQGTEGPGDQGTRGPGDL